VAVLEFYSTEQVRRDESLIRVMANVGTVLGRVVERTRAEQALAAQNDQLRQVDALKDEFVSLVSHELRTPLTSIRGYLELVLEDEQTAVPEEHRQYLAVVQRNSERLLRLVGDLLFVAQLDAGRLSVEREELDLATVAAESVQAAGLGAGGRAVEIVLDAEPARLAGDRSRLAQLLDNLVSNAVKFTAEGGRVEVRVRAEGDDVVLEVADSGMGIPADEQAQLFERFFRSTNARRAAVPGTGLGLVIVQAIVQAHGGTVSLESTEGVGTTFSVRLPARPSDRAAGAEELPMQEVA
jgi:signal transduction histidine kinase